MASLQQIPSGVYYITIPFGGRRYKRSVKTTSRRRALAMNARAEEITLLVEQGRIESPESVDVPTFMLSDGKLASKRITTETKLQNLFDGYFASLPVGTLESGTINMMEIHQRHLVRHLGRRFSLKLLSFVDLQGFVNLIVAKAPL